MVKRIITAIAVLLVVGFVSVYLLQRYHAENRMNSGDVASQDDRADSSPDDRKPLAARVEVPAKRAEAPITNTIPAAMMQPAAAAPATDSIAPNPPNGQIFAGTGHFQVYRQGNLTWRLNTDNGTSCILFATLEEWRKELVYSHGCRQA